MKTLDLGKIITDEFNERLKTPKDLGKWMKEVYENTDVEFIKILMKIHEKENQSWKDKDEILVKKIQKLQDERKKLKETKKKKTRTLPDRPKIIDVLSGKKI